MAVVVAPALVDLGWGGWYYALACDVICAWDGAMGAGVGIGLACEGVSTGLLAWQYIRKTRGRKGGRDLAYHGTCSPWGTT